jgi:ribonuclease J
MDDGRSRPDLRRPAYPGVELILPDLEPSSRRIATDLLGIVLTHGHEDHIGALPYLAADLGVPLYATPFTAGLIAGKLEEEGLTGKVKVNIVERGGDFRLGPFGLRYVPLAHSIPEGNALLIDTPFGRIFHTGDWKLDDSPQLGDPSTAAELLTRSATRACSLWSAIRPTSSRSKASGSEATVREGLDRVIGEAEGRVLVTTFASNAARLKTLGHVATTPAAGSASPAARSTASCGSRRASAI